MGDKGELWPYIYNKEPMHYVKVFSPSKSLKRVSKIKMMSAVVSWFVALGPCLLLPKNPKFFQDSPSHRIFRRMHGVLNIDKNKN